MHPVRTPGPTLTPAPTPHTRPSHTPAPPSHPPACLAAWLPVCMCVHTHGRIDSVRVLGVLGLRGHDASSANPDCDVAATSALAKSKKKTAHGLTISCSAHCESHFRACRRFVRMCAGMHACMFAHVRRMAQSGVTWSFVASMHTRAPRTTTGSELFCRQI